jgi:hypothetical protein
MSERDRHSGRPDGEPPTGRGLPALPAPSEGTDGERTEGRPVASWLGWSPTRWRSGT